jgi:predicted aldo/keto reductase-like oxidoreductase
VKASACVKRCPSDVEIIGKMREAVEVFETSAA